ncbi:MAG: leucyl aminopeptidase [Desulfuromonadales bacterium]|nr:leucyl aminopeptidase [Desulfuromonadales bacterium]
MELKLAATDPLKTKTACLVLGAWEKGLNAPLLKRLDDALQGELQRAVRNGEFSGKEGELLVLRPQPALPAERILLLGLGSRTAAGLEPLRRAAGQAVTALRGQRLTRVVCALPLVELRNGRLDDKVEAVAEGALLAGYRFDRYLPAAEQKSGLLPKSFHLLIDRSSDRNACQQALNRAEQISRGACLARTLVNEPGNTKSPAWLAEQARAVAAEAGLHCTVLNREDLRREGFGALLGVAQGSEREPCLILLEHRGGPDGEAPVALVGKGVVFDSGGISLKPAEKMDEMKMDMAGGAAVIGTLLAAGRLQLPVNLLGVVPAVENLPSGTAIRPGDILTSLSGKTIEVLNTDAEGRMILADALTYVQRFAPRLVIDLATLTGACIIALGRHASAVLGNDQALVRQLLAAGEQSGERLWQLPLWPEYDRQLKSDIADVKNTGGRPAGTITAAAFLQRFVDKARWAHLDIAGTAWNDEARPYAPKGGSGVGVRLLLRFLRNLTVER